EVEEKRQRTVEGEKAKRKKRKSSNSSTEDDNSISTSSSSNESEKRPLKKTKILADLKCKKIEESDMDSEILEEIAEEEAAFVKLAKNQIYQKKQAAKEAQEAEK